MDYIFVMLSVRFTAFTDYLDLTGFRLCPELTLHYTALRIFTAVVCSIRNTVNSTFCKK